MPETVELAVTLVVGADPIRGSTRFPDGEDAAFWGWLELAGIVQDVTNGQRGPGSPEGARSRG